MTEKEDALRLAHAVLDKPHIDPDGDISMLARQFLRAREEIDAMREALEPFAKFADGLSEKTPDDISLGIFAGGGMSFGPGATTVGALRHARAILANFTVPGKP